MKKLFLFLPIALVFLLNSCKKDGSPDPTPVTPKPDTLSIGWRKVTVNEGNLFSDIFFNVNSTGYLGGEKLYKSIDGGTTWNLINNRQVTSLAVTDDAKLFFVNFKDSIFRSVDGGATITFFKINGFATDIYFVDNVNGYCITNNGLYNTTDGGSNWVKLTTSGVLFASSNYSTFWFKNTNEGWIVNSLGVYRTNGSILNWAPVSFTGIQPTAIFSSVFVTPNGNVYLSNSGGEIYKSTDGGITFSQIKILLPAFTDIHFVDNNTGYVCVSNRVYKTTDAGSTWNVVVALGETQLVEIHFTDATHGWVCGSNGTVLILN